MRFVALATLLAIGVVPVAAVAANATPIAHRGAMLRDADNVRIGLVDSVKADGSVGVIYDSRYIVVPADSLSITNGKLVTKLTKAQVNTLK